MNGGGPLIGKASRLRVDWILADRSSLPYLAGEGKLYDLFYQQISNKKNVQEFNLLIRKSINLFGNLFCLTIGEIVSSYCNNQDSSLNSFSAKTLPMTQVYLSLAFCDKSYFKMVSEVISYCWETC